jgi:hypothetical protein
VCTFLEPAQNFASFGTFVDNFKELLFWRIQGQISRSAFQKMLFNKLVLEFQGGTKII